MRTNRSSADDEYVACILKENVQDKGLKFGPAV